MFYVPGSLLWLKRPGGSFIAVSPGVEWRAEMAVPFCGGRFGSMNLTVWPDVDSRNQIEDFMKVQTMTDFAKNYWIYTYTFSTALENW